ncbi:MerR family transcriptional regulator [Yinghuangia seranimata]|uniref:transcriptional regulator FtsR n=1 Tax=Yinghuangia seranimata TaxID=408067 RepID=UPI00248C5997|nr:MerR family transcriptional regulator [Yinghuangia seranimata]MDI2129714.1 MerR family transcriptional regulator [Yinghuangia seranimata]
MAMLRAEFPDVSISKIRFLEAEGLVEPQRTPSGYRKFGPSDIDRLRFVLRAQRDQYLPLKVIKDQLDAIDRGLEPDGDGAGFPAPGGPDGAGPDGEPREPAPVVFDRAELLAAAGIDEAALARLEEFGLIEPEAGPDGAPGYGGDALVVARLVTALGEYGLEPRHLRQVKAAADREAALVEQIVAPLLHRRGAGAKSGAEETVRDLLSLTSRLHTVLVGAALRPLLGR